MPAASASGRVRYTISIGPSERKILRWLELAEGQDKKYRAGALNTLIGVFVKTGRCVNLGKVNPDLCEERKIQYIVISLGKEFADVVAILGLGKNTGVFFRNIIDKALEEGEEEYLPSLFEVQSEGVALASNTVFAEHPQAARKGNADGSRGRRNQDRDIDRSRALAPGQPLLTLSGACWAILSRTDVTNSGDCVALLGYNRLA